MDDSAVSVYGLTVTGLGAEAYDFGARPASDGAATDPTLHVRQTRLSPGQNHERQEVLTDDEAQAPLIDSSWLSIERWPVPCATFALGKPVRTAELLHPWLVPAAATVNMWHGRRVFHGGLVSDGSRALAVVGDKEAGKSSILACASSHPDLYVMADDLVVVEGTRVHAGPSSIDLRAPSLPHLPAGANGRLVRDGTRTRLLVRHGPATAEFVGIVILAWSPEVHLHGIAPHARLGALLPHTMIGTLPLGRSGLLDVVRYPTWRLGRPRDWSYMPPAIDHLRSILAGSRSYATA